MSEAIEKIKKLLRGRNAPTVFIIIGAVLILLILLSGNEEKTDNSKETTGSEMTLTSDYEKRLEEKLEATLSEINGVGKVSVMITLSSSEEYIYAEERDKKTDSEKISFVKSGEGGIIKKVRMPVITGAVIVCEGGGNTQVCERVYEAVSVSLGISSNRISVLKMQ